MWAEMESYQTQYKYKDWKKRGLIAENRSCFEENALAFYLEILFKLSLVNPHIKNRNMEHLKIWVESFDFLIPWDRLNVFSSNDELVSLESLLEDRDKEHFLLFKTFLDKQHFEKITPKASQKLNYNRI